MSPDTVTQRTSPPRASSSPGLQVHEPGTWAAYVAEGPGTFGLVFAGCGAIVIDALSGGAVTHVGVGLVFGLVITVMIYAFGHLSGAHFNPAVTLAFVLARHFPARRLIGYWSAQLLGATMAAGCVRLLLGNVAHLGATVPTGLGGPWQSLGMEILLTFFLMIVIMAMATDTRAVGQAAQSRPHELDMDGAVDLPARPHSWSRHRSICLPVVARRQSTHRNDTEP